MSDTPKPAPKPTASGFLSHLLRDEARLLPRLARVLRFDPGVYAEIQSDPGALPSAFLVVIGSAVLSGLGAPSLPGIFLGIAGAILLWGVATGLVWAVGTLSVEGPVDYAKLLACLGFARAWSALAIGGSLPLIGGPIEWAALLLWAVAVVQATRQVLEVSTERAVAVCAVALGLPVLIGFLVFG
jgi:hypothetical protein